MISQIGLLFLGVSFFSNSICHNVEKRNEFKLREEDFLRLAKLILPATNLAISKMRELFSGEPSMTLKVITKVQIHSRLVANTFKKQEERKGEGWKHF